MSVALEALNLLPVPPLASLSDQQLKGDICIWSGEALTAQTAVRLGEREHDGRTVFLRASRTAVERIAMSALFDHCTGPKACAECKANPDCPTGRALNRLIRGGAL